jgi:sugar phosphate isomerase/epimerase
MTRRGFLLASGAALASQALKAASQSRMGIAWTSYMMVAKPKTSIEFLEHSHSLGAAGIQTALNGNLVHLRERAAQLGMYVEAMVGLPGDEGAAKFEQSLKDAKTAGAACVRAGALGGRRYENFSTLEEWRQFAAKSERSVAAAAPLLEKHKIRMALENHKDWTVDELVALMKKHASEYLGVCLDFGNNISLLDDPLETAEKLAPYTFATHLKDMAVQPYADGFLMSEMPLGQGFLDLPRMISLVQKAQPTTRFSLEMITRDPLRVPCLTDKYWTTFPDRGGAYLARTLRLVEQHKSAAALPETSGLSRDEQLKAEEDNVRASFRFAQDKLGL